MRVILVNPQIPQNTGSIARTCAACQTPLTIIGETPFEISAKSVRRAGLDYWPHVNLSRYEDWESYRSEHSEGRVWLLSSFGERLYYEADFHVEDHLVFGSETSGLPREFIQSFPAEQRLTIPMSCPAIRSLNLSNAVSIVLYEGRRQLAVDRDYSYRKRS